MGDDAQSSKYIRLNEKIKSKHRKNVLKSQNLKMIQETNNEGSLAIQGQNKEKNADEYQINDGQKAIIEMLKYTNQITGAKSLRELKLKPDLQVEEFQNFYHHKG